MATLIKGKNMIFYATPDGVEQVFCLCTDNTLEIDIELLETTGPASKFRDYIAGAVGSKLSGEGLAARSSTGSVISIQEWALARQKIPWRFSDGSLTYSGLMLIETVNITTQFRDAARFTFSANVCGDIGIVKGNTIIGVYLATPQGVRLAGCPNPYPVGVLWYDSTFIGIADNADDVINLFNAYAENDGSYQLTSTDGGCNFTMQVSFDAAMTPSYIIAVPGDGFVIGTATPGEVIGVDNSGNVLGP